MLSEKLKSYITEKNFTSSEEGVITLAEIWAKNNLHKPLSDFTKEEAVFYLNTLGLKSFNSVKHYVYLFRDWGRYVKGEETVWSQLKKRDILDLFDLPEPKRTYIDRIFLLNLIEKLPNPADAFILLGLFEGLSSGEIYNLCEKDFEFKDQIIYHAKIDQWFQHSLKLLQLGRESLDTYIRTEGKGNFNLYDKQEGEKSVIKLNVKVSRKSKQDGTYISACLFRIYKSLCIDTISISDLRDSGLHDLLDAMREEIPIEKFATFRNPKFKQVVSQYGKTGYTRSNILQIYKAMEESK